MVVVISGLRAAGDAPIDVPSRVEGIVNIRLLQSSAFYRHSAPQRLLVVGEDEKVEERSETVMVYTTPGVRLLTSQ